MKGQGRTLCILLALLLQCLAQTDISNNNCPDQFNVTEANTTTGVGNGQIAVFFYSPYMSSETVSRVEEIIIKSNTTDLELLVQGQYTIPFILIAAVFGITFTIVVLCVVFEKSCPPCHSWRRDFAKRPYQKFEIRCVALFAVIFAIGILAVSIAAFTIIPQLQNSIKTTKCALYNALDVALNGDDEQWGGFSHIKNQVGNISELLPAANTEIQNAFNDDETIKGAMDNMKSLNLQTYTSFNDSEVVTPDPNATNADQYTDSYFIENLLGPNGTADTMVNEVDEALQSTQQLSDQANQILNSAFLLVESAATIQANTQASQQTLSMYENQLNQYKNKLDDFSNQYFDPFFDWGIYVVQVIVGFVLVASLAIIIASVSIQILDIYDCRHFLHFGWVVYGITYFGIVFITFFCLPMGSVGYTFCEYYEGMLGDQDQYGRLGDYDAQHILNRLDVCLYGDGNVLEKFQIADQMDTVSSLFVNIDTFNDYDDSTSSSYVDQTISQSQISTWLDLLEEYRQGIEKDDDPNLTTDANCVQSLQKMNQYTLWTVDNDGQAIQRCTRDRWVYDVVDCDASEHVFDETTDDALDIDMTYVTCFSLNTKFSVGSSGIWSLTDIIKRYKQKKQQCQNAYNIITGYAEAITDYRDSRIQLFQGLIDQMTSLQTEHNTFDAVLDDFRTNLAAFQSTQAIRDLNNIVTNQIDGLLVSSDCSPIADRLRFVYNTLCVNAVGQSVQLGICMMFLLCLLVGGMFTGCVYAQRTATIKRLFTIHEKNFAVAEHSMQSQNFQRRERSETSSSSSSEED